MNPNAAIKKALSSNRVKSTIADLGEIDFSILSENNPFDAAPAVKSGFNEASAGWKKYRPTQREVETIVTQPSTGTPMRTIRDAIDGMTNAAPSRIGKGITDYQAPAVNKYGRTLKKDTPMLEALEVTIAAEPDFAQRLSGIPPAPSATFSRDDFLENALTEKRSLGWDPRNYVNQPVATETTMVNPVVVANAADDALQLRRAQLGAALKALADGSATSSVTASPRMQLAINSGLGDELWNGAPVPATPVYKVAQQNLKAPIGATPSEWNGVATSTVDVTAAPQKYWTSREALFADADAEDPAALNHLAKNAALRYSYNISRGRQPAPPVLPNRERKIISPYNPDALDNLEITTPDERLGNYHLKTTAQSPATPEEVAASIPFYRQPAVMYGGLGLAGLGGAALAYNAFSAPSEEEPQPVYQAPAYGQMPRSFR